MGGTLVLVRHGQSEWNLKNLFTGWRNPDLTEKGVKEASAAGRRLKAAGFVPDYCFTSALKPGCVVPSMKTGLVIVGRSVSGLTQIPTNLNKKTSDKRKQNNPIKID